MNHYYSVHSSNPNFFVRCGVDDCPCQMDHVKECTSMLIKNVLSATEKSLISAWENHNNNEDFSTEIAKAFEKVQNPFAGLETSYLQTEHMKKNFNYVGYREEVQYCDIHTPYLVVVLNCIYCTQLKKSTGIIIFVIYSYVM